MRQPKVGGFDFLNTLMFAYDKGSDLSLLGICNDLHTQTGIEIKKQSISERFSAEAVDFLEQVLALVLEDQFKKENPVDDLDIFNRVRIKDSTRFALPADFSEKYTGHGGATANSSSMISIQYEYDQISGNPLDLRLTSGTRNDQGDSKENTHDIQKNDLFLRDLGYATLTFMLQVVKAEGYFLNRLHTQLGAYHTENPDKKVDFAKCLKHMKKNKLPYLEYEVLLGKKAKIPCRLVIYRADKATYDKRIKQAKKQAKSGGYQVSKEFKTRAWLTSYVTNTNNEQIPAKKIKAIYGLRWQIELTFKVWKSQSKISQVKKMKLERFECQLIAKLIWFMFQMKKFTFLIRMGHDKWPEKTLSIWKYYKHANSIDYLTRNAIADPDKLFELLESLIEIAPHAFVLEKKKGKRSHYEALRSLA